jgi:hypothetical protein
MNKVASYHTWQKTENKKSQYKTFNFDVTILFIKLLRVNC